MAKDGSYQRIIGIGPENKIIDKDGKTWKSNFTSTLATPHITSFLAASSAALGQFYQNGGTWSGPKLELNFMQIWPSSRQIIPPAFPRSSISHCSPGSLGDRCNKGSQMLGGLMLSLLWSRPHQNYPTGFHKSKRAASTESDHCQIHNTKLHTCSTA